MKKFPFTAIIFFISSQFLFSQHIDIDKKALSFLASQEKVNVVFVKDSLLMIDDLYEMEFIQKMRQKITDKTTAEDANNWIIDYNENKNETWTLAFLKKIKEKIGEDKNVIVFLMNETEAHYTMQVKPTWMYFGYDAGIMDRPAKVTLKIDFYENKSPNSFIFSTEISRAMAKYNREDGDGEGAGPSLNRMRKAFEMAGYKLAKSLERVLD